MHFRYIPILILFVLSLAGICANAAPIHDAAGKGNLAKVRTLIKANPKLVNLADKDGATPLHCAVAGKHKDVVEFLLTCKANVNAKKKNGVIPLHIAAAMGLNEITTLLLSKGGDPKAVDSKGRTPLSIAEANGNKVLAVLLSGSPTSPETVKAPEKPVEKKPDLIFENFNDGLGKWKLDGNSFTDSVWKNPDLFVDAPYKGELVGIEGKGYLNTSNKTDQLKATGTAISPDFVIDHAYIHLKIGGYKNLVGSGVKLMVDGKTVRTATGFGDPEKQYIGFHKLKHITWDVKEFQGKTAHIEVYDESEDSFVMVDSIVQSDDKTPKYLDIPNLLAIDPKVQGWLEGIVQQEKDKGPHPAVGACIVSNGKVAALAFTGERKLGSGVLVAENDAWQMGSISKSITATITAVVIEEGVLDWDTRIVDVFPELVPVGNPYREATVLQLLSHSAGFPHKLKDQDGVLAAYIRQTKDIRETYYMYARDFVKESPIGSPGEKYQYSGAHCIPVAMISKLTGLDYENMLQKYIVEPLGLNNTTSKTFVKPSEDPTCKFIWQHSVQGENILPLSPTGGDQIQETVAASGSINMSLADQAKFIIAQMLSGAGPRLLRDDTLQRLHSPAITTPGEGICPGWFTNSAQNYNVLGPAVHNAGLNGANYAHMVLVPSASFGFVLCFNSYKDSDYYNSTLEKSLFEAMPNFKRK